MDTKALILLIITLAALDYAAAISIGAGPSTIEFQDMVRGSFAEVEVTVSTAEKVDLNCSLQVTGDVARWITIKPSQSFVLPSEGRHSFMVILQLPGDVANDVYRGSLDIKAAPVTQVTTGAGFAVGAGVSLDVIVNVTGIEKSTYRIVRASVGNTEIGYPINFKIEVYNGGNVINTPDIVVEVVNATGNTALVVRHNTTAIKPSRSGTVVFTASSENLSVGFHEARVNSNMILKDEASNRIYEAYVNHKNVTFELLPEGVLSANGTFMTFLLDKKKVEVGTPVRVTALFKNTGEVPLIAKLKGELVAGQNFIAAFESDELEIAQGESKNLIAYFTPQASGKFQVKGTITYGKKVSDAEVVELEVSGTSYRLYAIIGVALLVVVGVFYKTRR
ncbi:MAG: hypothetical protein V1921_01640 [Candidatus Altiarchaeota archaeon]